MKKHFYSHIIHIESVFITLDLMDMKSHEREELMMLVESSVHHMVLDTVLSKLSDADKKEFLSHLAADRHDDIWVLLKSKTKNIETHILKAVEKLKKDLHKDIVRVKRKKKG